MGDPHSVVLREGPHSLNLKTLKPFAIPNSIYRKECPTRIFGKTVKQVSFTYSFGTSHIPAITSRVRSRLLSISGDSQI